MAHYQTQPSDRLVQVCTDRDSAEFLSAHLGNRLREHEWAQFVATPTQSRHPSDVGKWCVYQINGYLSRCFLPGTQWDNVQAASQSWHIAWDLAKEGATA